MKNVLICYTALSCIGFIGMPKANETEKQIPKLKVVEDEITKKVN